MNKHNEKENRSETRLAAIKLYNEGITKTKDIAKRLIKDLGLNITVRTLAARLDYSMKVYLQNKKLHDYCIENHIDYKNVKGGWISDKEEGISISFKNTPEVTQEELANKLVESMQGHEPSYKQFVRTKSEEPHLLVIDIADLHIGKLSSGLGDDYNMNIAVKRAKEGLRGILDKSAGFNIDKIIFIAGNDILHTDGLKRTTTQGTPQDTDGNWNDMFEVARRLYVETIEELLTIADVHYVHNISNHDVQAGYFLSQVMQAWFKNCDQITWDIDIKHRKYFKYGKCLIGSTHGDGAKEALLPSLMAHEAAKYWATTNHRVMFCHHLHHRVAKDLIGCSIQYVRSPSGTDRWHATHGFTGAPKAVEGFLFHPKHGQVANLCHIF